MLGVKTIIYVAAAFIVTTLTTYWRNNADISLAEIKAASDKTGEEVLHPHLKDVSNRVSAAVSAKVAAVSAAGEASAANEQLMQQLQEGWELDWEKVYHLEQRRVNATENVEDEVHYYLWTRFNKEDYYVLEAGNYTNIAASPFNASHPTYLLFHGFSDNGATGWITRGKDAYLNRQEANIIGVDYESLVRSPFYLTAVLNTYKIANFTALFIDSLVEQFSVEPSSVTLVGHSLGGQAAGITGNYVTKGTVGRVSGLDPAGPLFYSQKEELRINKNSGDFVDVMHANACFIADGCYGMSAALGDVDFYPNGGRHQPGCVMSDSWLAHIVDLIRDCSHMRAVDLWVESIGGGRQFTAHPCQDWESYEAGLCSQCPASGCLLMGDPADISQLPDSPTLGYYLTTNAESLYAQG